MIVKRNRTYRPGKCNGSLKLKAYSWFKEIGMLTIHFSSGGIYKIEEFRIKESQRKKGIGKKLLSIGLSEIKKYGGGTLYVYPLSEPYKKENPVEISTLYQIYEHLGFQLYAKYADREHPINKMLMEIDIIPPTL